MRKKTNKLNKDVLNTKVGKYFMAVQKGKSKKEACTVAGYAPTNNIQSIEDSSTYQALTVHFKDSFGNKMSMDDLSDYLIDNIKQEGAERVDRSARNGAIKIALDKLEPENPQGDDDTKVLIVLGK